jgi:hypothetical protein
MKIQFVYGNYEYVESFDVVNVPTEEESEMIQADIWNEIDKHNEEYGDLTDFAFWQCCSKVVLKYLSPVSNRVVKTFYI